MPPTQETGRRSAHINLGADLRAEAENLSQQGNHENISQFFRALIKQVVEVTDGKPFDVRDLVLKGGDR